MADKDATPPVIREDIAPNGDVLLRLQQPYKSETTEGAVHNGSVKESEPAENDANKISPPVSSEPPMQTVELVVLSSTLRLVSPVFGELLDKQLNTAHTTTSKDTDHIAHGNHARNDSSVSNDSASSLTSPPVETASLTPLSSPMAVLASKKKKKKKLGLWGEIIGEESTPETTTSEATNAHENALSSPPTLPLSIGYAPPSSAPPTPPAPSYTYILELPEVDSSAMTLLMRHVHFRLGDPCMLNGDGVHGGLPSPELLEKLAYVCTKYKCTHTLQAIGDSWVSRNMDRLRGEKEQEDKAEEVNKLTALCHLLVFAYAADQASAFTDLCWQIILNNTGPISRGPFAKRNSITALVRIVSDRIPSVPERILGKHPLLLRDLPVLLEARRLASCNRYHQTLVDALNERVDKTKRDYDKSHRYIEVIMDSRLFVRDLSFPNHSINSLMVKIDLASLQCGLGKLDKNTVLGPRDSLTCLDCIRTIGESHKTHKCRVSHS